ncbi:MAG: efflux RND transporter permease subunit [Burkholderiaceae bacterium]
MRAADGEWLVRVQGQSADPEVIARIPIIAPAGRGVRVGDVARVERARADAAQLAFVDDRPAITFAVNKKSQTNTIELVERLGAYIEGTNPLLASSGLALRVGDDQTIPTRRAIDVMQTNALQGLVLVVAVCWIFLGWRVAVLVGLGIPFSLAGTFAVLSATGFTLNISVLLGSVIALGMLVDDAVVVVESIYYRIERGQSTLEACIDGVREVFAPVISSVATTMAAFLPLMLMPGIVGKFMFVIPFVVTVALAISLAEAFWMLPTHVSAIRLRLDTSSRSQRWRNRFNRGIRLVYGRALAHALRHPAISLAIVVALIAGAGWAFASERVRVQFFAFDALRIFYVNVDMPPQASIVETSDAVRRVERAVRARLRPGEARSLTAQAGLKFTETEPLYGDPYGQVIVSLLPQSDKGRDVDEIIESMRMAIESLPGPGRKSFLKISGGPPLTKPISVKVRADDYAELRAAVDELAALVRKVPGTRDVVDDDVPGRPEMVLALDAEALRTSGLNAAQIARIVRLAVDGEVVSVLRDGGDRIEVRAMAETRRLDDVTALLQLPIALPASAGGGSTTLGALTRVETRRSKGIVRHYNLRRSISVEADLDKARTDTVVANKQIREAWDAVRARHPNADLEFGGELEDIQESLDAMARLFAFGVGLIYLILAAQFRSYYQPMMILATIPLAFAGVTFGLLITGNPLSLFTMYGVIALTGIAVNSAIVLIDATNARIERGFSLMHAVVQAARRRVVPVMITSLTTVAGLFALATGLGGRSLLWGPVASSIVWGLGVSTLLTLFVIPLLFAVFSRRRVRGQSV